MAPMTNKLLKLIFGILLLSSETAFSKELVTILFNERSPFIMTGGWGPYGLVGDIARTISIKSTLNFDWKQVPLKRQRVILKENKKNVCVLGPSKSNDWNDIGIFTLPIFQEKDIFAFTRASDSFFKTSITLQDVFSNKDKTLIIIENYAYQDDLEDIIKKYTPPTIDIGSEVKNAFRILKAGRGDYVFMAEKEGDYLIFILQLAAKDFKKVKLIGLPSGKEHHILCSKSTSKSVIDEINRTISEIQNTESN